MDSRTDSTVIPGGVKRVLLHTCCAPCSGAIIEWLMANGVTPVIYYCNPNIYPYQEYLVRKNECTRFATSLGLEIVDADYDHNEWLCSVHGLENEPERGCRCLECFKMRLLKAAEYASSHGFTLFTSTLDSSRWKRHDQIVEAGVWAASHYPALTFWDKNWRKGGLQERRAQIIGQNSFYNQRYCGCEYSMHSLCEDKGQIRARIRLLIATMTDELKALESERVWERLEQTELFKNSNNILIYWSMADEVQTPAFIERWAGCKQFYLPSIQHDSLVVKRYNGICGLVPGMRYAIPEPEGEAVESLRVIDLAIVPGRAFDANGGRLGRGRGFYDRLLPLLPHTVKAGVCFDCQILPRVPISADDVLMDVII